jgi:hypothetical protein
VALSRKAVITYGPRQLTAFEPIHGNRLWTAEVSDISKVTGLFLSGDKLVYVTDYEGSPQGIGWVRDLATGRRLWWADGVTPLGVDGNRVIAGTPGGDVKLVSIG